MKKAGVVYLLTALWALTIMVLTLIPGSALPEFSFASLLSIDKLVHFTLFFILTYLFAESFNLQNTYPYFRTNLIILCILISFLYGFILEGGQYFIPDRSFDPLDLLANTTGAVAGGWTWKKRNRFVKREARL